MVDVVYVLVGISLILFFGFFSEFLFKKIHIPDVLFLIFLGIVIGPYGFNLLHPSQVESFAPVFTTFALLFLIYEGAFNIDLSSLAKGALKSMKVTIFNFFMSVIVITGLLLLFRFSFQNAILTGFILGGVSSAFVIPILKQMNVKGELYSVLALESAFTDVLCIVFAFTTMEFITLNSFNFQAMIGTIVSLFATAGLVGIIAGIVWIILIINVFKESKFYMITIAYLIMVYAITELLKGNGAIAALFFGLTLKNSRQLTMLFSKIIRKQEEPMKKGMTKEKSKKNETPTYVISVTTQTEELFYSQISFFLKTFFFVYIGILLNLSNPWLIIIGGIISVAIMSTRPLTAHITKELARRDQRLIGSIFARGLAAAAIAQVIALNNIEGAQQITQVTYAVIAFTIILSSIQIFLLKRTMVSSRAS